MRNITPAQQSSRSIIAAHMPLIALYWDNMMLAYSSKLDNVTVDAVFGLNNVNNWFSITKK